MQSQTAYKQLNAKHPEIADSLVRMLAQGFSPANAARTLGKRGPAGVERLLGPACECILAEDKTKREAA
jgi:hypothetical protein